MSAVLIYILVTLGALLGIILLVPINFGFRGEFAESLSFQGQVGWAGGLFRLEIIRSEGILHWAMSFLGMKKSIPKSAKETPASKKPPTKKKVSRSTGSISTYINRQLFAAVKVVLRKLVQSLHLNLNLSGTYGFDDPSLTGVTAGLIAAIFGKSASIELKPDFTEAVVDVKGSIRGWFIPLQIVVICIVFSLSKPVRAIWWPKIKFRKKQKEVVKYA